jgi:hypothetical protein
MRLTWGEIIRQWGYPPEFRIGPHPSYRASRPQPVPEKANSAIETTGIGASPGGGDGLTAALDQDLAISVCNEIHRIGRNLAQMKADGHELREIARIERAIRNVSELFEEEGVLSIDLSGAPYDDHRGEFDPVAPPDPVPGLTRVEICRCERPVIIINGKLVQRARGTLGKPV